MSPLAVASVVVLITIFVWFWMKLVKRIVIMNKIPGPRTIPLIGYTKMFTTSAKEFYVTMESVSKEYAKDGVCSYWLAGHPIVLLSNATAAEVILHSSQHMTKSYFYSFLEPWLKTGLLTSTGSKWHYRRKLLTPTFHYKILKEFLPVFNEQAEILVSRLHSLVDQDSFDMQKYITMCTLDIICDTAMGRHVSAQSNCDSPYVKAVYSVGEDILVRVQHPWLWPTPVYRRAKNGRENTKQLKILHDFTKTVINERNAELDEYLNKRGIKTLDQEELNSANFLKFTKSKRMAFLDMLLLLARQEKSFTMSDIQEEVDTFMFEGHDTTAAAAVWAVHMMATHEDVQKRVHQELDAIFGDDDRPITNEDLGKLNCLECVIKETLRLFPSVPIYGRNITEDCKIGGFDVLKGSTAFLLVRLLHRDPKYFPDPEKFDPDRWTSEIAINRHPYSYVPFSAGLRNCIGQKFAMMEEKVLLAHIMRRFNLHCACDPSEIKPTGMLILRPLEGLPIRITPRLGSNNNDD